MFLKSKGNLLLSQSMIISVMAERGNLIASEMLSSQICSFFFFFNNIFIKIKDITTDTDSDASLSDQIPKARPF